MKVLCLTTLVLLSASFVVAQTSKSQTIKAIEAVLEAQRDAWNKGDIDGYMDGYERSKDTIFVSGDNVTHGWETVRDRYKKGYDSPEKIGQLTFSNLETTLLGSNYAYVIGSWSLKLAKDQPHGRFTLILRKGKSGWRIIHDHTTSL